MMKARTPTTVRLRLWLCRTVPLPSELGRYKARLPSPPHRVGRWRGQDFRMGRDGGGLSFGIVESLWAEKRT